MTSEKSKVRVTVSENGPYMVTGDIPLAKQSITTNAEHGSGGRGRGRFGRRASRNLCAVPLRGVANQTVLRRLTSQNRFRRYRDG